MPFSSANNFIHDDTVIFGNNSGIHYRNASTGRLVFLPAGVGLANNYLAIDVSGNPTWVPAPAFSLADDSVTFAKLQNLNSQTLIGRVTGGTGDPEMLTATQGRSVLGLGTAATLNTGTAAGNIPVLGAGGVLDAAMIPALRSHEFVQVANAAARLALTTAQVQPGDEAYELDTLRSFKLVAADPTSASSWIVLSDAAIDGSEIVSGVVNVARIGTGTKDATTVYHGDGVFRSVASGTLPLSVATANTTMAAQNRYYANGTARLLFALPAAAAAGSVIELTDINSGFGWRITQAAGQRIFFPDGRSSTVGTSGFVENPLGDGISTARSALGSVTLECIAANNTWLVKSQNSVMDFN